MRYFTASQCLLARALLERAAAREVADSLAPIEFYDYAERQLFGIIARMADEGADISPKRVHQVVKAEAPKLAQMCKELALLACDAEFAEEARTISLAAAVHGFKAESYRIRMKRVLEETIDLLELHPPDHIEATLDHRLTQIRLLTEDASVHDDLGQQITRVLEHLYQDAEPGLRYGYRSLDRHLAPALPGNVIVIAGATGAGKSMVMRNLVRHWVRQGVRCAIHSLEMTAEEHLLCLACMDTGIDQLMALKPRELKRTVPIDHDRLVRAATAWKVPELRINDRSGLTVPALLQTMRRYQSGGFLVQVIDHGLLLDFAAKTDGERRDAYQGFASQLKSFAKNTHSIVLVLLQLKKISKHQEPNQEDVREMTAMIDIADRILMVYQPLIAWQRDTNGDLWPMMQEGTQLRIMADRAPKTAVIATDTERVYLKAGKQRFRPPHAVLTTKFNEKSGLMYDLEDSA